MFPHSTRRMCYAGQVEKMSIKISTQTHTHTQLMFCSTPNMIMGVRTRILSTRATRGKMKTVGVLERKSYRRPLQSRNCNWDNNLPHSTDHTYPTIRRLLHNALNRRDVDHSKLQKTIYDVHQTPALTTYTMKKNIHGRPTQSRQSIGCPSTPSNTTYQIPNKCKPVK